MMRALVLLVVWSQVAAAEPWVATRGTLAPGRLAGSFLLATEVAPGRFSNGEIIATEPVTLPFRIDVRWRRLGPEGGRSMHVTVADAVVLLKTGKVGLYAFDEAKFAALGWTAVPGLDAHAEHTVSVRQDREEIVVSVDGKLAARFALPVSRAVYRPGVGFKGAPGFRSSIYVRSLAVTPL